MTTPPLENLKFEQAVEQLENIIEQIENGSAGLQSSLKHYEQGTHLIKHCSKILEGVEQKIQELTIDSTATAQSDDN